MKKMFYYLKEYTAEMLMIIALIVMSLIIIAGAIYIVICNINPVLGAEITEWITGDSAEPYSIMIHIHNLIDGGH